MNQVRTILTPSPNQEEFVRAASCEPLTLKTLFGSLTLLLRSFPYAAISQHPILVLPASLLPRWYLPQKLAQSLGFDGLPKYFLIKNAGTVVAISGLYCHSEDSACAWLGWTSVSPLWRRRSVGTALVKEMAEHARADGKSRLKVYCNNDASVIAFYKKLGFKNEPDMQSHGTQLSKFSVLFVDLEASGDPLHTGKGTI